MKISLKLGWLADTNTGKRHGEQYEQILEIRGNEKHCVATSIVSLACTIKKGKSLNHIDKKRIDDFVNRIGNYKQHPPTTQTTP